MVTFDFLNQTNEKFPDTWVSAAVESAWKVEGLEGAKQVEISILPDEELRKLNQSTRGKDYVPDVLSFPMSDPTDSLPMLGEMYVSASKVYAQAQEYGHSHCEEFLILCIHGMFHLLGYDHIDDDEWEIMRSKEAHALELAKKLV